MDRTVTALPRRDGTKGRGKAFSTQMLRRFTRSVYFVITLVGPWPGDERRADMG